MYIVCSSSTAIMITNVWDQKKKMGKDALNISKVERLKIFVSD